MRNRYFHLPTSWWVPIAIPFSQISEYLSEQDYEKYKGRYLEVNIQINLILSPASPDVGITSDTVEYNGDWSLPSVGNYPDSIMEAIEKHLVSIDVPETYGDKLTDRIDCYVEQMKTRNDA